MRALLVEDVAGLRRKRPAPPDDSEREPGESAAAETEAAVRREQERELARARLRALVVAVACAAAVAALFVLRDPARPWLVPGRHEEGVFTIGILVVAAYAGFRFAGYLHLRNVARLYRELAEREE